MGVDGLNSCSSSSSSSSSSRMRYLVKTQDMVIGSSFMVMLVYCDGVIQARIGGWCVCVCVCVCGRAAKVIYIAMSRVAFVRRQG